MASIAQLRRAAAPFAAAAFRRRRRLPPPHRSLPAAAAPPRSHFCTAAASAWTRYDTTEENKSVLQRMVDRYCFEKKRDMWPAVVKEILMRRQRRADGGEVVREYLRTRHLVKGEKFHVGAMDLNAELWKNILTDHVPFSYKSDHGGEIPKKLLLVVEELGEMCVNGEILGDHAYKLVTYIMEDMAAEIKGTEEESN